MDEISVLKKENEHLRRRIDTLEKELASRDLELRDGLLLIIRGVERRQKIGRYAETQPVIMAKEA